MFAYTSQKISCDQDDPFPSLGLVGISLGGRFVLWNPVWIEHPMQKYTADKTNNPKAYIIKLIIFK